MQTRRNSKFFIFWILAYEHSEFMVHRHRDALNNFICHKDSLAQIAIVENESAARVRYNLLEVLYSLL